MMESNADKSGSKNGEETGKKEGKTRLRAFDLSAVIEKMKEIDLKKVGDFFRRINVYRKTREALVGCYLSRTASVEKKNLIVFWQPLFLIIAKIAVVAFVSFKIWELYPIVGKWMKIGLDFFKLHEIYNFRFPGIGFFESVANYLFLFILGYHGLFFLYHQLLDLFSVIAISAADGKVFYVRNLFLKKELYVFSIPDIALIVLRQNILARLIGVGTISLQKRSGEQVAIRSVGNARTLLMLISDGKKTEEGSPAGEPA